MAGTKTAAKKKATTKKKVTEDLIVTVSHEIENMEKEAAYEMAGTLADDVEFNYFKLGGVLARIYTEGWYTEEGFDQFKDFVEAKFGIKRSKAMYLISIYNGLVESGVEWADVKDIGWSKLKELAHILTKKNVKGWVKRATDMTVIQLLDYIKKEAAKGAGDDGASEDDSKKVSSMTFKVHEDQKETINNAIGKAKKAAPTDVSTVALEMICLDYIAGPSKKKKDSDPDAVAEVDFSDKAVLKEAMGNFTWEDVLGVFEEIWPDVDLTVVEPE